MAEDDNFWVDPDGLDRSSGGFTAKGEDILNIAARIRELTGPQRIWDAMGGDRDGKKFAEVHLDAATNIYKGVGAWGEAVRSTGDSVKNVAHSFSTADDYSTDSAKQFGRNLTAASGGDGGGTAAAQRTPASSSDGEPVVMQQRTPATSTDDTKQFGRNLTAASGGDGGGTAAAQRTPASSSDGEPVVMQQRTPATSTDDTKQFGRNLTAATDGDGGGTPAAQRTPATPSGGGVAAEQRTPATPSDDTKQFGRNLTAAPTTSTPEVSEQRVRDAGSQHTAGEKVAGSGSAEATPRVAAGQREHSPDGH